MTGTSCPKKDGLEKAHLTIEITQPVELQYRPYLKRGWVIFPLARSIVIGPRSIHQCAIALLVTKNRQFGVPGLPHGQTSKSMAKITQ